LRLQIRKFQVFREEITQCAGKVSELPLVKAAAAAIIHNPFAGRYVEELKPLIDASEDLGKQLAARVIEALSPYDAQSYGKAAIVGVNGEQEHANAVLTTTFATPLREAVGGGKAWISSMSKCGSPGISIDVPLASKDALYVRSHYDGMSLSFHDAPYADEIVVILCVASRGRLNARVGGLALENIKGLDGLS
jgi:hypothetical protein